MNPFGFVKGLFNRVGNTVNNDVIQPINRDFGVPVNHAITNAWQFANPASGVNQATPYVNNALKTVQATPAFQALMRGGHPSLQNSIASTSNLVNQNSAAAETDMSNPINQLQLGQGYGTSPQAVIHEALHRQWALNPNDHQNFINAYQQELKTSPQLAQNIQNYLQSRLQGYKGAPEETVSGTPINLGQAQIGQNLRQQGNQYYPTSPNPAFQNISSLDPNILNEVHSYLPEFYSNAHAPANDPLGKYYSQFFNPTIPQSPFSPYNQPTAPQSFHQPINQIMQSLGRGF